MPRVDDELPYEELDPCCQREIDDNRRNLQIKYELRRYDRSNHRLDIQKAVLGNLQLKTSTCICCNHGIKDYPLLVSLRERFKGEKAETASLMEGRDSGVRDMGQDDQNSNDDDDEFDDLLNEVMTPYEVERMNAVKEIQSKVESARAMGYGVHHEESVEHLMTMISDQERVVCHIYDPSSLSCAYMDVILENLAAKYFGTRFRRIPVSSLPRLKVNLDIPLSESGLLCFMDGSLIHSSSIHAFGIENDIYLNDVERFLDHTHILSQEVFVSTRYLNEEAEERDEAEKYCDEPGCGRRFAHEHVGSGFSFLSASDALPKNHMQSL